MHVVEAASPAPRVDAWAVSNAHCQAHYQILAEAEPDLLCRVLNYFALQFLIPVHVNVQREEDVLAIDIIVDGLSWHRAQVIGEKLRNLISVCSLELHPAEAARPAAMQAAGQ
ncbi:MULTISPECIES: hypothetical protein [unclassified Pseudomonas]|uniref:hypothetical protein n=1 Tax=unclassified Pseudomonas TaxID=196821 RepID=UPI0015A2BA31|nr:MULTISPECIES: hypothetical protein [unclassified Pseudomonas]NWC93462.1 hypothetical protein [Pseudomonas sp. IPO3779]NWD18571.1 hypothetical protein [Pseudomonas sp. IPO3778]